jgi:DNA-binding transcriptional ArsR family regulator
MKEPLHVVKSNAYHLDMPSAKRLEGDVRIDDPAALRALAHPARLTAIDELYQGSERTSSELAELTGLTPSAMSYHLRALERWGMVERGEARGDGRERPWRAAGRTLSLDPETVSAAATDIVAGTTLQHLREEFRRWAMVEPGEGKVWRDVTGISRGYFWLTEDEVAELSADLRAVFKKHTADRDTEHHPEGTRRVFCLYAIVPEATASA